MAHSKKNGSPTAAGTKKALRTAIESKLTEALLPFHKELSDKKFKKHIKKASKLLSEGLKAAEAAKPAPAAPVKKKAAVASKSQTAKPAAKRSTKPKPKATA